MEQHCVFLALGTNLGNLHENLERACREIEKNVGQITDRSQWRSSEPWGFDSPNTFLNGVVKVETPLSPLQLLSETQAIERRMGRRKKTKAGYEDRIVDIDILLYDDLQIDLPQLKIPHPLMELRDFVMIPLKEITEK